MISRMQARLAMSAALLTMSAGQAARAVEAAEGSEAPLSAAAEKAHAAAEASLPKQSMAMVPARAPSADIQDEVTRELVDLLTAKGLREIERMVAYQIGAAQALATYAGHKLTHVKAHGALGNLTQQNAEVAKAVNNAIWAVDRNLICLTIALGHQERQARERGMHVRSEIFADRAYTSEGYLVDRSIPGAVIHDGNAAADRAIRMVQSGSIETIDGKMLKTDIDSICVHSDTPAAVKIAAQVRAGLEQAGIRVVNFIQPKDR